MTRNRYSLDDSMYHVNQQVDIFSLPGFVWKSDETPVRKTFIVNSMQELFSSSVGGSSLYIAKES